MAGKFSIYKYVKLQDKHWRYARAAYHPNGKIKPNIVLVKDVNGRATEEKHTEGFYFLNFNNTWIPAGADALEAQHKRKVKLNQAERERFERQDRGSRTKPRSVGEESHQGRKWNISPLTTDRRRWTRV